MKKQNKGITLIALVITIIVLLILAGVSIATLTGENGILTQANNAKTETAKAEAEEEVKLAIMGSYGTNGKIDYYMLKTNLNNIKGISGIPDTITEESFPITVTVNGENIGIKADGSLIENKDVDSNVSEWDETATSEDCFEWGSNNKGEDGYNTIVGYTEKLQNEVKLKLPTRCTKIRVDSYGTNDDSRSFCSEIKVIEIPDTVIEIGRAAFAASDWGIGFQALQKIEIPDSVKTIGSDAFLHCSNLTEITIPDSVTSIGHSAFWGCTSLNSIVIPSSVTNIEFGAFHDWTSDQTINLRVSEQPETWDSDWNSYCNANIVYGYTGE